MDILLIIGAIFAVLIGIAHSILGERYILVRLLRRSKLPEIFGDDTFTRKTLRFVWHLATIAWTGFAIVLLIVVFIPASGQVPAILKVIGLTFLVSAIVTLGASRGRHLAWSIFLSISVLVWLGSNH